jgi:hypothetical protein
MKIKKQNIGEMIRKRTTNFNIIYDLTGVSLLLD